MQADQVIRWPNDLTVVPADERLPEMGAARWLRHGLQGFARFVFTSVCLSLVSVAIEKEFKKVEVPDGLKKTAEEEVVVIEEEVITPVQVKQRRGLSNFWGKFKDGIIDLFKEEEDKHL